jgi:hypothetical protein
MAKAFFFMLSSPLKECLPMFAGERADPGAGILGPPPEAGTSIVYITLMHNIIRKFEHILQELFASFFTKLLQGITRLRPRFCLIAHLSGRERADRVARPLRQDRIRDAAHPAKRAALRGRPLVFVDPAA